MDGRKEPDAVFNIRTLPGTHSGADPLIMKDFREFVRFNRPPAINPVAALKAVLVGIKGHESMRGRGERLDIPALPRDVEDYFRHICEGRDF